MKKRPAVLLTLVLLAFPLRADAAVTFGPPVVHNISFQPQHVAIGDVNGDGVQDLLVVHQLMPMALSVLNGQASGSFGAPGSPTHLPQSSIAALAVAEINGDGRIDAAVGGPGGVTLLFNNGMGGFSVGPTLASASVTAVTMGDLNGDAKNDIVWTSANAVFVSLGYLYGSTSTPFGGGGSLSGVAVADGNGNSLNDVLVVDQAANNLRLILGNGDGTFNFIATFNAGSAPTALEMADLDNDGRIDAIVGGFVQAGAAHVRILTSANLFASVVDYPVLSPAAAGPAKIDVADVDADGFVDVLASNNSVGRAAYLRSNGSLGFHPEVNASLSPMAQASAIAALPAVGAAQSGLVTANANAGNLNVIRQLVPPGPVVNLQASPGAHSIALTWDPPATGTVTGYQVYRDATLIGTPGSTFWTDCCSLDNNETHTYDVRAMNQTVPGPSVSVTATTADVPTQPLAFGAVAGPGAGQIRLSWSPPADDGGLPIQYYAVYREDALIDFAVATGYTDSFLGNGATHTYAVSAVNAAGEGPPTAAASATTFDVPSVPSNVSAQPGTGLWQAVVSWDVPGSDGGTPILGYTLCRRAGVSTDCADVGNVTSFTDEALVPLATYRYTVEAYNLAGAGAASAEVCTKPFPWLAALGC